SPQCGRQVGIGTHGEMKPADPGKSARPNDTQMLEVALRPSSVTHGDIDQRWRTALVGALQLGEHANLPTGASEKCGLHEIVALNVPPERRIARQGRQPGGLRECSRPENGVMSP